MEIHQVPENIFHLVDWMWEEQYSSHSSRFSPARSKILSPIHGRKGWIAMGMGLCEVFLGMFPQLSIEIYTKMGKVWNIIPMQVLLLEHRCENVGVEVPYPLIPNAKCIPRRMIFKFYRFFSGYCKIFRLYLYKTLNEISEEKNAYKSEKCFIWNLYHILKYFLSISQG